MLILAQKFLRPDTGLLFLVLPLPCILNSRYTDADFLVAMMVHIGFECIRQRWKVEGGKVAYWLFRKVSEGDGREQGRQREIFVKKVVRRDGKGRNNFAILLPG